jgi:Right handed beta helix region
VTIGGGLKRGARPGALAAAWLTAAAIVLAAPTGAGAAEIFTVDSTRDLLDADTADNLCATAGGRCTLRAAIQQANVTPGTDIVKLPNGTFELERRKGPADSNDGGDLMPTDAVRIEGRGSSRTIVRQTIRDRVLTNAVTSLAGTQLTGLTITGGRVTAPGNQLGGGILNDGVLTLERVTVRGNSVVPDPAANSFGGGISQTDGILILDRSRITRNLVEVDDDTGGGLGGGIAQLGGFAAIERSRIAGNTARQIGSPGLSTGGGILVRGAATITNTTIAGNRAVEGAGIAVDDFDATLSLEASTLSGNEARRGGGLHLFTQEQSTILNSTISGNAAPGGGSAIMQSFGAVSFQHVTIARNRATGDHAAVEGGEFADADSLDFYASIINGKGQDCGGNLDAFATDDQNVFGDPVCSPGISTDRTADPRLRRLAKNGGPTATHALRPNSPAIDLVTTGPSLPTDQRGRPRPLQASDAGSFERQ